MDFELRHAVFPILPLRPQDEEPSRVYCDPGEQGSAFFITQGGVFLTAKHVVDKWSADSYSVIALDHWNKGKKECRVRELERHGEADVAIGLAEEPPGGWASPFTLSGARLGVGASVLMYGFANSTFDAGSDDDIVLNMAPRRYGGHIIEYLPRAPMLAGPCYHMSCDPGGGISGGPLIRKRTMSVHGLVSAGIPRHEEGGADTGFATDLAPILDSWPIPFLDGLTLRDYAGRYPKRLAIR